MSASWSTTVIYPVSDLASAKAVFGALVGVEPYADTPYYVGYSVDGKDLGLDPNGHKKGMTGPVTFWSVPDIEAAAKALVEAGATTVQDITDVGGGKLVASVKDADGNMIGLMQQPA